MVLLGCGSSTGRRIIDPPVFVYPDQSTPKHTVLRMAAAVVRRDSVMTDSVYADDYEGTSIDLRDPSPETLTFTKADEIGAVGAMARSSSIISVVMDLGLPAGWNEIHYASDPPGWIAVQIPAYSIYVNDTVQGEYQTQSPAPGETILFELTLKPITPAPSSPTDTTWTIVRWVESRDHL